MKRILILLIIGLTTFCGNSQTITVFNDDFSTSTTATLNGWVSNPGDFYPEDGTGMPFTYTNCNVASSSAGMMMGFYSPGSSGSYAETSSFSTLGKSTMTMDFNCIIENLSNVAFVVQFSNDNFVTSNVNAPFVSVANNGTWAAVASFAVPSSMDNQPNVKFRIVCSNPGNPSEFLAIDDIRIIGLLAPIYYYNGTGAIDTFTAWGDQPNGSGNPPTSFTGIGQTYYLTNAASVNLNNMVGTSITFGGASSTLNIGTGASAIDLIMPTTHTLFLTGGCQMVVSGQAKLTIQNTSFPTSAVTLSAGSTIDYAQTSGLHAPIPFKHYNMFISGGADISSSPNFTVSNNFNISNGHYRLSTNPNFHLFLEGPISITGSGAIKTTGARLVIHGTGAVGAVNFSVGTTPLTIGQFTLNRPGQTMTLGNDLTITSNASVSNGNVNLNGKIFKFNGANTTLPANAAAGTFVGSSSSAITFSNAGAVTGQLNMDQTSSSTKTLKALTTQKSLTLGNSLEITDSLKVTGVTLTNNGGITFRSSATLKGRIANSTGSISGNITVETFAQGGTTDWTNLGVSGVSGLNLSSWDNPTTFPMTCIGCINATTSVGGGFASAVRWDESLASPAAYVTMSNSDPLTPGKGFWMYLGLTQYTTADMNWSVTGPAVTGPVTIPLTVSTQAGYNLISNPYASPIRWSLLRASNSGIVNDVYYVYDPDMGLTRSFVSGLTAPTGTQVAYDIIPAGQGFYVEATSGGNLTANESNKVSFNTGANQLLKSSENNSTTNSNVGSYLRINIDGGGYHDDAVVRFHTNATPNFDGELDAHKIYASPGYPGYPGAWTKRTVIGTQTNNEDYSINSLPHSLTQNAVLPVVARVYTNGSYTISASDIHDIPAGTCINLKDYYTNTTHDLTASDYIVNMSDTTYYARFELTICPFNVATGIKTQVKAPNSIAINKDAQGIFVDFDFKNTTKANITVTNILGQKIMDTKKVKVTNDNVYLDLNVDDQLIFVTVETENEKVTKKFLNFR